MGVLSQTGTHAALGRPAVRAKFLQLWLSSFTRFDAAAIGRLEQIVGVDKCREISALSMLSWVPIELDVEIVDAVAALLGRERFSEFTRAYVAEIMPQPPLGALIDLGTKLIGVSPESFLRWWDRGWNAVYRACGKVKGIVTDDTHGRVVYEQMPRVCTQSQAFVDAVVSTAYAVYGWTGHRGAVHIAALKPEQGYLELELTWRAKS